MNQQINKELVLQFYKKIIREQDLDYIHKNVADNYIQHNPNVRTGKEGLIEAIQYLKNLPKPKDSTTPFMRVIADQEFVVLHLSIEFQGQKKKVLDLFRIENERIAEHWDAIQNQAETSLSGNHEVEGPILIEDQNNTLQNKKIIENFTTLVLLQKQFQLSGNFIASDLIQHHPEIDNGLENWMGYYKYIDIQKVYRIIAEGNFVVTQSKGIKDHKAFVFYDIYRLYNGLIQEHWSVSQEIPKIMAHGNGMI